MRLLPIVGLWLLLGELGQVISRKSRKTMDANVGLEGSEVKTAPEVSDPNKVVFEHAENGVYRGRMKGHLYHGMGEFHYKNGDVYNGSWEMGFRSGVGTMTYGKANQTYVGMWSYDKREGYGIMTYSSGDVYEGDWKGNKRHGNGNCSYASGDFYAGDWVNDKRHGQGMLRLANRDEYSGEFQFNRFNGKGTMKFANGALYVGDFRSNSREGTGVFTSGEFT